MLWWALRKTRSKDPQTRKEAVSKLALAKNPRAVPALMAALHDENDEVRLAAIDALREIGSPESVKALETAIEQTESGVRSAAVTALAGINSLWGTSPAICALWRASQHADENVRVWSIAGLLEMGSRGVIDALIQLLRHESPLVRKEAILRLQHLLSPTSIYHLKAVLKDTDATVRKSAAEALGNIAWAAKGHQGGLARPLISPEGKMTQEMKVLLEIKQLNVGYALTEALKDENPGVKKAAKEALDKVR